MEEKEYNDGMDIDSKEIGTFDAIDKDWLELAVNLIYQ